MECVQLTMAFPTSHVSVIRFPFFGCDTAAICHTQNVFACANEPIHKGIVKLIFSAAIDGHRRTNRSRRIGRIFGRNKQSSYLHEDNKCKHFRFRTHYFIFTFYIGYFDTVIRLMA